MGSMDDNPNKTFEIGVLIPFLLLLSLNEVVVVIEAVGDGVRYSWSEASTFRVLLMSSLWHRMSVAARMWCQNN